MDNYERASGQWLNKDKIAVFFSKNIAQLARDCILSLVGVSASQCYDTYLGLPALVGRSRVREFQNLKDKVKWKVTDWKKKFLS